MKYSKILLAVLIFLLIQAAVGMIVMGFEFVISGYQVTSFSPMVTGLITIVSGVISVIIIGFALHMMELPGTFLPKAVLNRCNVLPVLAAIIGTIAGIFATNLLSEQMNLPDLLQTEMAAMSTDVVGVLGIAIMGPIIEELVFREAIAGYMLRQGANPWKAILISALLFGIVHINPSQVPFAFLMGIALAILYWRTGNIWLCGFVHILNNSLSVIQMNILGDRAADFMLTDWLGGAKVAWPCLIASALACVILLSYFCHSYRDD